MKIKDFAIFAYIILAIAAALNIIRLSFESDLSYSVIQTQNKESSISSKSEPLLAGKSISGEITAKYNYLGVILIPMQSTYLKNSDRLLFKLYDGEKLLHETDYDVSWVTSEVLFPFGFPPIINSQGKTYKFVVTSLSGSAQKAVFISNNSYKIQSQYQFPKKALVSNILLTFQFLSGKVLGSISTGKVSFIDLLLSFSPLILFSLRYKILLLVNRIRTLAKIRILKSKVFSNPRITLAELIELFITVTSMGVIIFWRFLSFQFLYLQYIHDFFSNLYPNYVGIGEIVRNLQFPTWTFSIGLGTNIFAGSFMRVSVVDPFTWPSYFVSPTQLLLLIPYILLVKVILAAVFFYLYLRFNNISHRSSFIFGIAYAFCGQMIVRAPWYHYTTEMVFIPLLLIALDQLLHKKRSISLIFAFAWIASYHLYYSLLYTVFAGFYLYWKHFLNKDLPSFSFTGKIRYLMTLGLKLGIHIVSGFLVAGIFFIPNLYNFLYSSRSLEIVNNSEQFYSAEKILVSFKLFLITLLSFFGNGITGYMDKYSGWSNTLEDPILHSSIISLLFFFSFPFYFKSKRKFFLVTTAIFALYLFVPPVRNLWNIFYGNRFKTSTFFITSCMLLLASMSLDKMMKMKFQNIYVKVVSFMLIITLVLLSALFTYIYPSAGIKINLEVFIILIGVILTIVVSFARKQKNSLKIITVIFVLSTIFLNARYISKGGWLPGSFIDPLNKNISHLDSIVQNTKESDHEFYRIQKDYGVMDIFGINDPISAHYPGVSSYQSFNELSLFEFLTFWGAYQESEFGSRLFRGIPSEKSFLEDMIAQKYFFSDTKPPEKKYQRISSFEGVNIYKNKDSIPFGSVYTTFINIEDLKKFEQKDLPELIHKAIVVDNTFEGEKKYSIGKIIKPDQLTSISETTNSLSLSKHTDTYFEGSISLEESGVILFPIPYNEGWKLKVNDENRELSKVNGGLMGSVLVPGSYNILLQYSQPLLNIGILVTSISLLALLVVKFKDKKIQS